MHWTLLGGVLTSGALMLVGLAIALFGAAPRPEGAPADLAKLIRAAATGDGTSIIDLALLVLMITPPMRVVVLGVGWAWSGNRRFAAVALTVLTLLALSVFLGIG